MTSDRNDRAHEDDLLGRLYQQLADTKGPRYAASYDDGAQLTRFRGWLQEHATIASAIKSGAEAIPAPFRPMPSKPGLDADQAVAQLRSNHYRSLVRLAGLLVRDEQTAEEVVRDSFIALHDGWHRLRDEDKGLSYLKQTVVNRCRSVLRHRDVMDRNTLKPAPQRPVGGADRRPDGD